MPQAHDVVHAQKISVIHTDHIVFERCKPAASMRVVAQDHIFLSAVKNRTPKARAWNKYGRGQCRRKVCNTADVEVVRRAVAGVRSTIVSATRTVRKRNGVTSSRHQQHPFAIPYVTCRPDPDVQETLVTTVTQPQLLLLEDELDDDEDDELDDDELDELDEEDELDELDELEDEELEELDELDGPCSGTFIVPRL